MPDEQYPTMPFKSPYIHTADSGPSAIVYYPQPIYEVVQPQEDIYSSVSKKADDSDNNALERLSQLVSKSEAPLAKPEDSSSSVAGSEAARGHTIFQELDEAFTNLDLELGELEAEAMATSSGGERLLVSDPTNV